MFPRTSWESHDAIVKQPKFVRGTITIQLTISHHAAGFDRGLGRMQSQTRQNLGHHAIPLYVIIRKSRRTCFDVSIQGLPKSDIGVHCWHSGTVLIV